jgi:hypothetical protein
MPVVTHLSPRIDLLTGFPVTGAEAAIVEDQDIQPACGEHFGEAVQVHLFDRRETVRHDHGRTGRAGSLSRVKPAAQCDAFGVKRDIPPCHPGHLRRAVFLGPASLRPPASHWLPVWE